MLNYIASMFIGSAVNSILNGPSSSKRDPFWDKKEDKKPDKIETIKSEIKPISCEWRNPPIEKNRMIFYKVNE